MSYLAIFFFLACFAYAPAQGRRTEAPRKPNVVAVIPARGGSKGIPMKNIKDLGGRPLIDWCIKAALDSGVFSEVYVSTDHDEIAAVALRSGAKVFRRSAETASDTASTESALIEFAQHHGGFDVLALIQATSPLVLPEHFREAYSLFEGQSGDSLVTAVRAHRFLWQVGQSGQAQAKNYDPLRRPRRQEWDGELVENGAFYFTKKHVLERYQNRLGGKIVLYEMPENTFVELDSLVDWEIMVGMSEKYGYKPQRMHRAVPHLQRTRSDTRLYKTVIDPRRHLLSARAAH